MNSKPDPQTRKLFERTLRQQSRTVNHRLPSRSESPSEHDNQRVNCHKCTYFYVTWQKSTPYGCRAHGFKSALLPSMVVFSNSGEHCLLYRPRVS